MDPRTAVREIRAIRDAPPPFPPLVQLLGSVLATMGLAVLLGSSGRGMLIAGALGVFTGALQLFGLRVPLRYQALVTVTAAAGVSLAVFLLARFGWSTDIVPSLIAPLVTLLPGALLTTGVIELASGQMISGAGRLAAGATQLMLLALGIVGPALLVGIPALELTATKPAFGSLGPWLAVAAFGIGIVVNRCARPRSMGWILIVLYVAYGAQVLGGLFVGGMLSAFVGALAMTPVADLVARQRSGPPAIVSFTPAFWILVPGALGLMGVATLLSGDDTGTATLLTTVVTMIGIALGVLVGRARVDPARTAPPRSGVRRTAGRGRSEVGLHPDVGAPTGPLVAPHLTVGVHDTVGEATLDPAAVELLVVEPGVEAAPGQQLGVGAPLDELAVLQTEDHVGVADGGEPVGDGDRGAPLGGALQRLLDEPLGLGVQGRGGLVEDQHPRVHQQHPGDGEPLLLPAGQPVAALAGHGVVALARSS